MNSRSFALVLGVGFVIAGIAGFFPTPAVPPPDLTQTHGFGHALGILPVNTLHNIVHLLFGLIPIYGADVWLHAIIAAASAYFGFVSRD